MAIESGNPKSIDIVLVTSIEVCGLQSQK